MIVKLLPYVVVVDRWLGEHYNFLFEVDTGCIGPKAFCIGCWEGHVTSVRLTYP